jgi:hypothetical protein
MSRSSSMRIYAHSIAWPSGSGMDHSRRCTTDKSRRERTHYPGKKHHSKAKVSKKVPLIKQLLDTILK